MSMSRGRKIALFVAGSLLVLLVVGVIVIALLVNAVRGSKPTIASNSVLVLRIEGDLPDFVPNDPLAEAFGGKSDSLTSLLWQIRKAKVDKRISGLLLDVRMTGLGWGRSEELRDAVIDFRASGKPAYAYMEYGANKEYFVASACEKVYVAPPGDLYINGLAAEVMFFRGSLDKLGVYPDFYQIGQYKNAPDQYTRKNMSDAHKEVLNSMLDDLFNHFVTAIATARKKSPEEIKAIIDNAPISSKQAKEAGLIDDAMYEDQVRNELKKRLGYKDTDTLKLTSGSAYREVDPGELGLNDGEKIAIVYASGVIGGGSSNNSPYGEQTVGSETMIKAINDAAADKDIKAIVIRVDSPGGSSYASDVIWHAIENAKAKKPVVISMGDVAASGGYYIACNANKVIAEPSTITGSIGVFAGKPVLKGFYDWIGVSNEYVMRGKNAGLFRETEKFTDDERKKFEEMVNSTYYDEFIPKVAVGRNRDKEYIHSIAQGRVWMGDQAKDKGLVDDFGGLEKAIDEAKILAKLPLDKDVHRVIFPAPRTFLQQFFNRGGDDAAASARLQQQRAVFAALPEDTRRTLRYAAMMDQMKNGEVMAMMPFDLRIK
ncbi:MAG: signal peptide peptidase SppA [Pyrinomonadaceae bacterium]